MKKRLAYMAAGFVTLASAMTIFAGAQTPSYIPYNGYEYNLQDESVAAPIGYTPSRQYTAEDWGLETPLSSPADIYYDKQGTVYLLDSGNSRILALDKQMQLKQVYDTFTDSQGAPLDFTGAQGLTVGPDGVLYVADTERERLLLIGPDGRLLREIGRPDEAMTNSDLPFDVTKVLLDNKGSIYAIAKSVNAGAFVFSPEGEFLRFYGSNTVKRTAQVLYNFFFRRFMTKEQLQRTLQATPINLSNFDADAKGFVYTCTLDVTTTTAEAGWVRKLNYTGDDVLNTSEPLVFGDLEWDRQEEGVTKTTSFVDIDVDANGFINLLDSGRGKVFQYAEDGVLIAVFGGYGQQKGTFGNPVALESVDNQILVVDAGKNLLAQYAPTAYASHFQNAILKLQENDLEGSLEDWNAVNRVNTNNTSAYNGIGRVYDAQGDYQTAMAYFKKAGSRQAYSDAWREYRKTAIRDHIVWLGAGLVLAVAGIAVLIKVLRRKLATPEGAVYSRLESRAAFPLYTLFHPVDGFSQFKKRKIESYRVSLLLMAIWFLLTTLEFFYTGFIFNQNRAADYDLLVTLFRTAGLFVLFVVSNWAICTLFNGNGNLKEIVCVTAYSLLPMLLVMALNLLLSNFLSLEESAFMGILTAIGVMWSFLLLLCGLHCIHEYTVGMTLVSIIITVLGMAVIVFIAVMFFTLLQQTSDFFRSIYSEIALQ